jgi:hypothetical protein
MSLVTATEIKNARYWLEKVFSDYNSEIPRRIHAREHGQHYGLGSAPPFAPEFIAYIGRMNCTDPKCKPCREDIPVYLEAEEYRAKHSNPRTRVTKAFRKLRRAAPTEFDVLYMAVVRGLTAHQIAERLNERAIAGKHPERYNIESVALLTVLGTEKLSSWY